MVPGWAGPVPVYHMKFKLADWLEEDRIKRSDAYTKRLLAEKQDKASYFKTKEDQRDP